MRLGEPLVNSGLNKRQPTVYLLLYFIPENPCFLNGSITVKMVSSLTVLNGNVRIKNTFTGWAESKLYLDKLCSG